MMGLLPMFGERLGVGAEGVGLMRAALSAGGLTAMTIATHRPNVPARRCCWRWQASASA